MLVHSTSHLTNQKYFIVLTQK